MQKHVKIFQHFSTNFVKVKSFVPLQCLLFCHVAWKKLLPFFFLKKKVNCKSCWKWLIYYYKMITFVKYRRGGLSFFIKAFCQNGWINRNWEPWRYYRWIWTIKVAKTTIFVENINTTHWRKRLFHCTLRKIIRDNPLKDYLLKYIAKHT